jgi:hypothetical protein
VPADRAASAPGSAGAPVSGGVGPGGEQGSLDAGGGALAAPFGTGTGTGSGAGGVRRGLPGVEGPRLGAGEAPGGGRASTLDGRTSALDGRSPAFGRLPAGEGRTTGLDGRISTLDGRTPGLDGRASALDGRALRGVDDLPPGYGGRGTRGSVPVPATPPGTEPAPRSWRDLVAEQPVSTEPAAARGAAAERGGSGMYPPMMGGGVGGQGREHRRPTFLVDDSGAFVVDTWYPGPVIGPEDPPAGAPAP